jgi:hypothetical protein
MPDERLGLVENLSDGELVDGPTGDVTEST